MDELLNRRVLCPVPVMPVARCFSGWLAWRGPGCAQDTTGGVALLSYWQVSSVSKIILPNFDS